MMFNAKCIGIMMICASINLVGANSALAASDLTIFDWAGYEDPHFFRSYVEKYGEAPAYSYFSSEQEAFSKVHNGFRPDLAHPCLATLSKWRRAGLIEPIDVSRIPQWDNLSAQLRKRVRDDGKVWMVPFEWGNSGLVYRSDEIPKSDVGLDIFVDPEYEGRVALSTDVYASYALAFMATGLDNWDNVSDKEFKRATQWLRRAGENVRFYWESPGQVTRALASGEIVAAWAWNQTWASLKAEGYPAGLMHDSDEGGADKDISTYICGYVDLKESTADNEEVYDFLNALLDPQSGKYIIEKWGYAHSNVKSFDIADPEMVESAGFNDLSGLLQGSFFESAPTPELRAKMNRAFKRIQAGF